MERETRFSIPRENEGSFGKTNLGVKAWFLHGSVGALSYSHARQRPGVARTGPAGALREESGFGEDKQGCLEAGPRQIPEKNLLGDAHPIFSPRCVEQGWGEGGKQVPPTRRWLREERAPGLSIKSAPASPRDWRGERFRGALDSRPRMRWRASFGEAESECPSVLLLCQRRPPHF